ncbi:MAG: DUF4385 family protein [Bradymonadaceae bacterium]
MSFPDDDIDYREHPEAYEYTPDERGVFNVAPYKSELLPHWSFATPGDARKAIEGLKEAFERYRDEGDFVGMDMVRKYLRMGFTRAMRYAKYPGGRKYDEDGDEREPKQWADRDKRRAAERFKDAWDQIREDEAYIEAREQFRS